MLTYNLTRKDKSKFKINIKLADTPFANEWKDYMIALSSRLPEINWGLRIGGCKSEHYQKPDVNQLKNYVHGLPECESKCALVELIETVPNISEQSYQWVNKLTKLDAIRGNNWKKSLSRLYELDPEMFDQIISNDVVKIQLTSLAIRAQ